MKALDSPYKIRSDKTLLTTSDFRIIIFKDNITFDLFKENIIIIFKENINNC